jgi:chaperonin GroEL (HSP60 family)
MSDNGASVPKRGFLATIARAATEIANGIDLAAGGETELGKKIRSGADRATSIDSSLQATKEAYEQSATRELVDMAAERKKRIAKEHGTRRSLLRSDRIVKSKPKQESK